MTEATHFEMPWLVENLLDQTMASQDLSPHPHIASDFSFGLPEDLDPIWSEQFNWNECGHMPKANSFQPYPQLCPNSIQPIPSPENGPIQLRNALATERALFMTPTPNMAFPFPTSPTSDPLSPDSSHSHSGWDEGDREPESESERGLYIGTFGHGQAQSQGSVQSQTNSAPRRYSEYSTSTSTSTSTHRMDEEDALTPLEMPDGSTRFTSNWLPVDPDAGFTIGSPGLPGHGDEMHFRDMQNAFFSSKPATSAWGVDR
ncbi:uncharacterized protein N7511_008256 [Penicillium nucicola]|uniref:uncharacterized protein n=1 Tax=Penicillium nucicola TaxID=1850975 RepID=UPI0025455C13|nr:uncharacterized protein N7511_008256 [Penicillium nucicola]KAJ5754103.1 hypothetical protein N7511_008256 [Penicillium nucicola]